MGTLFIIGDFRKFVNRRKTGNCGKWGLVAVLKGIAVCGMVLGRFFRGGLLRYEPQAKQKVFRCSSFSKMLPRCGRVAHICEANLILQFVFPAAIAFKKTV